MNFTPRVICNGHGVEGPGHILPCGVVDLTFEEYDYQMSRPDSTWRCPKCDASADWDDDCLPE